MSAEIAPKEVEESPSSAAEDAATKPAEKTLEQLEAEKLANLKKKFGNVGKPGGSDFLRKKLNKVKYFDSGDYQMAKQTGHFKPNLKGNGKAPIQPPGVTGYAHPTPNSISHPKVSEVSKLAV